MSVFNFVRALSWGVCFFILPVSLYATEVTSRLTMKDILTRGKLVVAIHHDDHPPFHMLDSSNNLIGIDIDIARKIGLLLNLSVEFNRDAKTFDELIDIVKNHQADLSVSKLSYTPERASKVRFTLPYIKLHESFIINRLALAKMREAATLKDIFQDPKNRLGVLRGTAYVLFAKELFPSISLQLEDDWEVVQQKLLTGELTGAFRDDNEMKKILIRHPNMNLKFVSIILKDKEDPICIALPQESEELTYWLNSLILHEPKMQIDLQDALKEYEKYL